MKLIWILLLPLLLLNTASAQINKPFAIEEATIDSVHFAIKNHQINCEQLVNTYLERIKKYNLTFTQKPSINAITQINPYVLDQARQIDKDFATNKKLAGPLHCIPVILKDNIDSFDTTTTTGSYALLGNQPIHDAFLVSRLRKAGAIILAKGSMDEFAWGLIGISSRTGRTGNAFNPAENPGGSSGGSAAAVSANFALIGIGTDNSGSVRIPAVFNGIIGLRPSTGMISQHGIFPMGNLDGTAGPLTRTTKDLAIVLDVIAQPDSQDPKTLSLPRAKSYISFLNKDGLKGKLIGIVHQVNEIDTFKNMPDNIIKILQASFNKLHQLGATTIDINLPEFDNDRAYNQAGEIEDINAYLNSSPATRKNFKDICESHRTRTFGTTKDCLRFMEFIAKKDSSQYKDALLRFEKNKKYLTKIMNQNHLDALLIPVTTHGTATYDEMSVSTWRAPVSSNSGAPSIAIIAGFDANKMPVGIELIGKPYAEGTLIEIAYAYETNSPPRLIPSLESTNALIHASIPELNNLFNVIGKNSYEKVFMHVAPDKEWYNSLTPDVFAKIVDDSYKTAIKQH